MNVILDGFFAAVILKPNISLQAAVIGFEHCNAYTYIIYKVLMLQPCKSVMKKHFHLLNNYSATYPV